MKTIKKIKSISYNYLKNYFFINVLQVSEKNEKASTVGFENGAEENCSLDFEDYKEAYMTRCRWS
jgi:hypothetical protein